MIRKSPKYPRVRQVGQVGRAGEAGDVRGAGLGTPNKSLVHAREGNLELAAVVPRYGIDTEYGF